MRHPVGFECGRSVDAGRTPLRRRSTFAVHRSSLIVFCLACSPVRSLSGLARCCLYVGRGRSLSVPAVRPIAVLWTYAVPSGTTNISITLPFGFYWPTDQSIKPIHRYTPVISTCQAAYPYRLRLIRHLTRAGHGSANWRESDSGCFPDVTRHPTSRSSLHWTLRLEH